MATAPPSSSRTRRWWLKTWCRPNLLRTPVDHRGRSRLEVIEERLPHRGREIERVDRRRHVSQPRVALGLADGERLVAEPQPRVPAALAVSRRPAPGLDEKEGEPLGRAGEVTMRVDGAQDRVARDPGVEALDQQAERGLAAGQLVHAAVEHPHAPRRAGTPAPARISEAGRTIACAARRPAAAR